MKTYTVTNRKGGVGKSTIAAHVAGGLALRGLRVGLIDTDSQAHAGLMLGVRDGNGLYAALVEHKPLNHVVLDVPKYENLWLISSGDKTFRIAHEMSESDSFAFVELCDRFAEQYKLDVIIVDTAPSMSKLDGAIYLATDGFIYPTECEMLSLDGLREAIDQMKRFAATRQRYIQRDTEVIGIIPTKMRPNTSLHRHNIAMLAEAFPGLVWTPIRLKTLWAEATNAYELIYSYAPNGEEATDAWAVVERVQRGLMKS